MLVLTRLLAGLGVLAALIWIVLWRFEATQAWAARLAHAVRLVGFGAVATACFLIPLLPLGPDPRAIRPVFVVLGLPVCAAMAFWVWRHDR